MEQSTSEQPPSPTEKKILDCIDGFKKEHGYPPSYREIMTSLQYSSTGSIFRIVQSLRRKGLLETPNKRKWRTFNAQQQKPLVTSPEGELDIIGTICGSKPPELSLRPTKIALSSSLFRRSHDGHLYALLVHDASFLENHLLPGDVIVIEAVHEAIPQGDCVLASSNKESIIGHFFEEGAFIRLAPSPYHNATISHARHKKYRAEDIQVWGLIVGMLRLNAALSHGPLQDLMRR